MCILCVEFVKGKMTVNEGWRNLSEARDTLEPEHADVVEDMLWNAWAEQNPEVSQCANSFASETEPSFEEDWYQDSGSTD